MKTVELREAKIHLGELVAEVNDGATVEITNHGVPVARLVPIEHDVKDALAAIEEWRRYRREHNITLGEGITIRELIEEGRE